MARKPFLIFLISRLFLLFLICSSCAWAGSGATAPGLARGRGSESNLFLRRGTRGGDTKVEQQPWRRIGKKTPEGLDRLAVREDDSVAENTDVPTLIAEPAHILPAGSPHPTITPPPSLVRLQARQDQGQIDALSAQLRQLSEQSRQVSQASQQLSQSSQQLSQSLQQMSQRLSQTEQSLASARLVASAAETASRRADEASRRADQAITEAQRSASQSASRAVSESLAALSSSLSSALSAASRSASEAMRSASSVARAAQAEATALRVSVYLPLAITRLT
jgi:vacuolar-type H+-ATPase subunit I/STV1